MFDEGTEEIWKLCDYIPIENCKDQEE